MRRSPRASIALRPRILFSRKVASCGKELVVLRTVLPRTSIHRGATRACFRMVISQRVASILTCPQVDATSADQASPSSRSRMCTMRYGSRSLKPAVTPRPAPLSRKAGALWDAGFYRWLPCWLRCLCSAGLRWHSAPAAAKRTRRARAALLLPRTVRSPFAAGSIPNEEYHALALACPEVLVVAGDLGSRGAGHPLGV